MTVADLIAELALLVPSTTVTVIDPHLHVDCGVRVDASSQWVVLLESTGRIVTEEDVS